MSEMHEVVGNALNHLLDDGSVAAIKHVALADGSVIMWLYPKAPSEEEAWEDTKALLMVAAEKQDGSRLTGAKIKEELARLGTKDA